MIAANATTSMKERRTEAQVHAGGSIPSYGLAAAAGAEEGIRATLDEDASDPGRATANATDGSKSPGG